MVQIMFFLRVKNVSNTTTWWLMKMMNLRGKWLKNAKVYLLFLRLQQFWWWIYHQIVDWTYTISNMITQKVYFCTPNTTRARTIAYHLGIVWILKTLASSVSEHCGHGMNSSLWNGQWKRIRCQKHDVEVVIVQLFCIYH